MAESKKTRKIGIRMNDGESLDMLKQLMLPFTEEDPTIDQEKSLAVFTLDAEQASELLEGNHSIGDYECIDLDKDTKQVANERTDIDTSQVTANTGLENSGKDAISASPPSLPLVASPDIHRPPIVSPGFGDRTPADSPRNPLRKRDSPRVASERFALPPNDAFYILFDPGVLAPCLLAFYSVLTLATLLF